MSVFHVVVVVVAAGAGAGAAHTYRAYNKLLRHVNAPTLVANASALLQPQRDTLRTLARLQPPPRPPPGTPNLRILLPLQPIMGFVVDF